MPEKLDSSLNQLPVCFDAGQCGYFPEKKSKNIVTTMEWMLQEFGSQFTQKELYEALMRMGWRRSGAAFYTTECEGCKQCIPIRLNVNEFQMSKSQKTAWRKNQDMEISLVKEHKSDGNGRSNYSTSEKVEIYKKYDAYHNGKNPDYKEMTLEEAGDILEGMNSGYDGIWNLEFRINGRLAGVSILDVVENSDGKITAISSNYFYYEVSEEIRRRSIGVFSVLKEIELCKELNVPMYYLGLFLPGCRKMNYKTNYKPFQLLLENGWNSFVKFEFPSPGELYPDYPEVLFASKEIPVTALYNAYHQGVFPWFNDNDDEPVLWQSPDLRFVIFPENFHVPKSADKFLKKSPYVYTKDKCFDEVMKQCGEMKRQGQDGTWIGPRMKAAYSTFHRIGMAHSYEVWKDGKLVGGFYGVDLGKIFCGESMFTIERDSAKSAFIKFAREFFENGGKLIDCQAYTDNMARFGAVEIPREEYISLLKKYVNY